MKTFPFGLPVLVEIIQLFLLSRYQVTHGASETKINGAFTSSHTLSVASSPYVATSDITVSKGTTLTIQAGVQINFQARVRLHVRGTLVARGSPGNEIAMFHNMTAGVDSTSIRLVGGNSPREGRVEVFNGQGWGTVCDDYWNLNHASVVCRHLGFGHPVETSTRRFGQGNGTIGLANVDCRGTENSLFDCHGASNWNNNNCQHSEDVGVVCGTVGVGYWGGIVFYADDSTESVMYNARKYSSNSVLENVKISNAGVTVDSIRSIQPDLQVPAITMTTASPLVNNVSIIDSSHIGIQMNTLHSDTHFSSLTVENSSSSGIVGSCSWHFHCDGCQLYDNGVAGIDVNSIPPLLKQPSTSSTPTYQATSSLSTSFSVNDRGAYLTFSAQSLNNDYQSTISTTSGYGLAIAFQRFSFQRGRLYIVDGVTGQTVLSVSGSRIPSTVTVPSHKAVFVFDEYSYSSYIASADITAFISRYPIGARGESLTDCTVTGRGRWLSGIRLTGSTGIRSVVKSVVTGTTGTGIQVSGSANQVTISFANVVNATSSWTTGITVNSRQAMLQIADCQIEGYQTGMNLNLYTYGFMKALMNNCTVRHNSYRGVFISWSRYSSRYRSQSDQRLQVSNCTFSDTPANQALYVTLYNGYSDVDLRVNITQNVFERNLQGLYFYRYPSGISATIDRNTFLHNDGGCCSGALSVYDRFYYSSSTHSPVIVENNVFTENNGEYVARLQTQASFNSAYQVADALLVFRDNSMMKNALSPRMTTSNRWNVKSTPNAVVLITGTLFTTVYHNIFDNPNATIELAVQVDGFSSLDRINVSLNWWGTANETKISEKIFDFDDSNHLAVASYFPFLLSSSISDVASSSHPRTYPPFLKKNGEVGGQLATDFSLSAAGGPYVVTRDITILPNGTLTVEAGTVLTFQQFVGVLVEGSLITNGTPDNPVIMQAARLAPSPPGTQTVVRLAERINYSWYTYGYVELQLDGVWQPLCLNSLRYNYTSLERISYLTCQQLGFDKDQYYSWWWWTDWFPALGDPIVHNFWCPENAPSFSDCTYNTSAYAPHSECLQVVYVECYCWNCPYYAQSRAIDGKWAGIRFAPTSSIPTGASSHRIPRSVLNYTEIRGAGRRYHTTVPSVQAIFRSPRTTGLKIIDSASTAIELSYLHEASTIRGLDITSASGDGLAIRRPRGQDLTIESVTVQNVTGAGIRVYGWTTSLVVNSNYQSICSGQSTIVVDATEGSYVGLSQEDHLPGITCSVILQGPPNTVLSVRVVSLRLYSDDDLDIRDGAQSTSSLLRSYQGYSTSSLGDLTISTGNNVFVEVRTGQKTGAPGFGLYVDAVDATGDPPSVSITDSSVYDSQYGVYFQNVYDDALIENVTVVDALNHGVYIYSHEGDVTVSKCFVVNAGSGGVYETYGQGRTTVTDNNIVNSSQGIYIYAYSHYRQSDCHITVSRNSISGARTRAAHLYWNNYYYYYYNRHTCLLQVSENAFVSSTDGLFLQNYNYRNSYNYRYVNTEVSKNIFSDNSGTDLSISQSSTWNLTISGNKFKRHRAGSGGCLFLQGYATTLEATNNNFTDNRGAYVVRIAPENITDSPFLFTDNDLTDNYVNDSSRHRVDSRSAVLVVSKSQQFVIRNNHFNNPKSLFELGVEIPVQSSAERVIDVSGNYWGTTDEDVIVDRIHDFGYCSRLASVEYFPYLTSPSGQPVSSSVARTMHIIRPNGIVRGRVASDTTLLASGSPYVVTGDVSVLPGRKLTIEAGVELRFSHNTGILVEGQLIVDGTPSSSVLLTDDSLAVNQKERYGLRLVGGLSPERGRVEVFYNGSWGPVCVVQNQYPWPRTIHDYYNTEVVCRELGYSDTHWQNRYVDPAIRNSSESAWLEHMLCRGNEDSLRQCANYILEEATCRYGQLVASCYSYSYGFYTNEVKSDKSFTHWTGIRFAAGATDMSSLRHVVLNSAGIANAGHIPAIQAFGRSVELYNVSVTNCAWTGVEVSYSRFSNISHSSVSRNGGTGVQLINTAGSYVASLASENNVGHGLAITVDSILQRMWNLPVLPGKMEDICAHSGSLSAATPFFLRFTSGPVSKSNHYVHCTATVHASSQHVVSVHVMAVRFQDYWNSHVTIDSTTIFAGHVSGPLHYSSQTGSMTISLSTYLYSSASLEENYFLAYVEQHPIGQKASASHHIASGYLLNNGLSGLAVNTNEDSSLRYDLLVTDSILSDNKLNGVDVVATSAGYGGYGSRVHTLDFERNDISHNGLLTTTSAYSTVIGGGIIMQLDKSNVVLQNNVIEMNEGGGVSLQLDSGSERSSIRIADNQIDRNTGGPAVSLSGTSGTTGPQASVTDNSISHNSAGILDDTLSITSVAATVTGNTFFNDTSRHVLRWETGPRYSVSGQQCLNNTFYLNVGQKPDYRWTTLVEGVAAKYNGNVFVNPANSYEFVAGSNLNQGNHDARNNWWGTADVSKAEQKVLDGSDESFRAHVDIKPVDTVSPLSSRTVCWFGWREFDSSCYLYVRGARTWSAANAYCQTFGGELVTSLSSVAYATLTTKSWLTAKGVWSERRGQQLCAVQRHGGVTDENCNLHLPFLCKKASAGDCPNSCSLNGQCNKKSRTCICYKGWTGTDCSDFDCTEVNDCSGYGTCVGPNQCLCRVGWKGRACTTTYCGLYTTCHACSRQPGCGWCDEMQQCIPGLGPNPDKQSCSSWFYYACYSPLAGLQCSSRIKEIGCNGPCDWTVATSSNETCQHCHDIERCYNTQSSCPSWNEDKCPYGRVTPDYGLGPNAPKIPSHLPLPHTTGSQRTKRQAAISKSYRRSSVDLFSDVRVFSIDNVIYRMLGRFTAAESLFITKPSLQLSRDSILASNQSGGILDKVSAVGTIGSYQLIKGIPASLEDVIKYADFSEQVKLSPVMHEAAVEFTPNFDALQQILNSSPSSLPGASRTLPIPTSLPAYKCVGNWLNGTYTIAIPKSSEILVGGEGIVSSISSGFIEIVQSIEASGGHTFVHTALADCTVAAAPSSVKSTVQTVNSPSTSLSPSITGIGGDGRLGLLVFENQLPSNLHLSVGDALVGRPSGPIAGYVRHSFNSFDDRITYIELEPTSGIGRPLCGSTSSDKIDVKSDDDLDEVVITVGTSDIVSHSTSTPKDEGKGSLSSSVCDHSAHEVAPIFSLERILEPQVTVSDGNAKLTAEVKVTYNPNITMTLRSNHNSPFVTKLGFEFDGEISLFMRTVVDLDVTRSDSVQGPSGIEASPLPQRSSPFCINVGSLCIPGMFGFGVSWTYNMKYDVYSQDFLSHISLAHEYITSGTLNAGVLWRNGIGNEFIKEAQLNSRQELPLTEFTSESKIRGRTCSLEASLVPKFQLKWPSSYQLPDHVTATVPSFMKNKLLATVTKANPSSSVTVEVKTKLQGTWKATECSAGCSLNKKLEMDSMAGVTDVEGSIVLSLRDAKVTEKLQPLLSSHFVDVVVGSCMKQDTDCSCECPGRASCEEKWGIQRCLACPSSASYCSAPCPSHTVERYNQKQGKVECKCRCADFNLADMRNDGSCKCGCTCQDGSDSTIGPDGQCDCSCKCNNCEDSTRGPSGCICPNDRCPTCVEGMAAVWQDCVCSCQSKQGRGGLPPVCADGWRGPSCDVPDCSPWPYCSDNGLCTVPSGNRADQHPYCVCEPQWIGRGCHIARPRRGAGDPHLETLDGISYDYFDIGEFWYCKSPDNDFGIASRFFKYQRVSLIGAVAVKAGHSVITITTPHKPSPEDLPVVRIDGVTIQLYEGRVVNLAEGKVHLEVTLYQNSSSPTDENDSGTILALIAFQWFNDVYLSTEVRYSPGMQRQFINILFSPIASFKGKTDGLCGYMDGDTSNDLLGADGVTYSGNHTVAFAKTWQITQTFSGSGLNGTWSWAHSNFHKDDVMDVSYTDPFFVPLYSIDDLDMTVKDMAKSLCLQLGLSGVKLDECIFDVAVTNDSSLAEQETFQIGCPTQCSGKGRCVNNSCVCISGWFGDDCSRGSCANCSINGDCLSGFCHCHFGWDGPFCERLATCYGVSNCTSVSHGHCKSDDVCECTPGYIGDTCNEKARCDNVNDCSGHGVCVDHDKCQCDMGWAGVNCTVHSCEVHAYCSGHGSCVGFDICRCRVGWGGGSCAIPLCAGVADCSGNGECVAPDVCQCYDGYSSSDCGTPDSCPELSDCSGNGVCVSDSGVKRCHCYSGYSGQNCSQAVCKGRSDCSGHGRCVEVNLCECHYGYSNANCSAYSCEKHQFCSGHGSCPSFDRCLCDVQWNGPACDIPDCSGVNNCTNASHGTCIGPDTCLCEAQYDGDSCEQIALQNANAPSFGMSMFHVTLVTTSRVASTIGKFPAKDIDSGKNGRLSYSLTSSTNNHTYFRVNSSSAHITLAKSLSLLLGSKLVFQLITTDEGVPPLAAALLIEVTVVEANKYCPVFKHLPSVISVPEDSRIGYVIAEATATDADGSGSVNGMVTYSFGIELQGNNNQTTNGKSVSSDSDLFSIDKNTGQITIRHSLVEDSYTVLVVASDHGSPQCSTTATVQVNVLSSNTPPICEPSSVAQSLPYTTAVGSVILQTSAVDPDSGVDGHLIYSLSNFRSVFLRHISPFTLTQHNRTAYLNLSSPLRGLANDNSASYDASFIMRVTDSARRPRSCSYTITLIITHPFHFKESSLSASIKENTNRGAVLTVTPSLELLTNLTYVTYFLHNADELPFSIHPTTGTVSVSGLLDYEAVRKYSVSIVAQTKLVSQAFAVAILRISVKDENDNPPRFPFTRYTVYVREDVKGGQRLLSLTASDADSVGGPVAYSYTAPDGSNIFAVSTASNGVTIDLDTSAQLDYQRKDKYELVIKTWDMANASLFSHAYVTVRVEEADSPKPAFSQRSYIHALKENTPNGESVLSIPALVNGKLSDTVTYSIVDQVSNAKVNVAAFDVSAGGNIFVSNTSILDYETLRVITFTLIATVKTPRQRSAQTSVTIALEDVNDNPPVFTEQKYDGSVRGDDPVGTGVLNITAHDADSGLNGQIAYGIVSGNDDGLFSINAIGEMKLAGHLDENSLESYRVTISAGDHGQPALSATTTATITVLCSSSRICPQATTETKAGISMAAIAGGSVGGVLFVVSAIVIVVLLVKKARKDKKHKTSSSMYSELTPHGSSTHVSNPLYNAQAGNEVADNDTAHYESADQMKAPDPYYHKVGDVVSQPVGKEPVYEEMASPGEKRAEDHHYDVA